MKSLEIGNLIASAGEAAVGHITRINPGEHYCNFSVVIIITIITVRPVL